MRSVACALVMSAVVFAGCEPERQAESSATAGDSVTGGDSVTAVPINATIADPFGSLVPDSVLVRRGACPFECCMYGDWAVSADAPIRPQPRKDVQPAFQLAANQRFKADSGHVAITKHLLVILSDTVDQRPYAKLFLPGDTLLVLDHVGEGHFNVWTKGQVVEVEGFWGAEAPRLVSEMVGEYGSEWWVHITMPDGRTGWLLVEPPMRLIGADKCGSPPPWAKPR
jgi:hypothetical protein